MKRLSSYAIYPICTVFPLCAYVIYTDFFDSIEKGDSGAIGGAIFILAGMCYFFYFISRSKRVFYNNSSLYLYNLFSNKLSVLTKDNIRDVRRFISYDPSIWKVVYLDENNNTKYTFFIRNVFCYEFYNIIDELNS